MYFAHEVMAVASPYAVFRAVDVIWPPRVAPVGAGAEERLPITVAPVRRPRKRRLMGAVQGELFPGLAGMAGGALG